MSGTQNLLRSIAANIGFEENNWSVCHFFPLIIKRSIKTDTYNLQLQLKLMLLSSEDSPLGVHVPVRELKNPVDNSDLAAKHFTLYSF